MGAGAAKAHAGSAPSTRICARLLRARHERTRASPRTSRSTTTATRAAVMRQRLQDLDVDTKRFAPERGRRRASAARRTQLIDAASTSPDGRRTSTTRSSRRSTGATRRAARATRARLRRPAPARRCGCSSDHAEVLRALPGALPLPAGRRVPGHEPGPVRAGEHAGEQAPQHLRRRRRRPGDLRVARRRRSATSSTSSATTPSHGVRAGAELPLDAAHPGGRERA